MTAGTRFIASLLLFATLVMTAAAPAAVAVERDSPEVTGATEWLRGQQLDDGSFSAFGDGGDPGSTADVVLAFVAAGVDPASVETASGETPITYLTEAVAGGASDPGQAGKVALALHAAGEDPRDAALITAITDGLDPETGFYGMGAVNHSYALLALAAVGEEPAPEAINALLNAQIEDGSWGFTGEPTPGTGDSNTTSLAIQALAALDAAPDSIAAGIGYLRSLQDDNGAVAYDATDAPDLIGDANSTAVTIQAFVAAGEDASEMVAALESFQNPGGAFFWREDAADDSLLATAQAVPALLEMPLPFASTSTGTQQAGLVVRMGDGTLHYATVEFDEPSIDGIELLSRSGLDVSIEPFGGMGGAVCSIEDEGCPSDDCFCHSYSDPAFFWHYYTLEDGRWVEHPLGASSRDVSDGDIDGWSWTSDEHGLPATTLNDITTNMTAPTSQPDDDRTATYLAFAGMVALVLLIGAFTLVRARRNAT